MGNFVRHLIEEVIAGGGRTARVLWPDVEDALRTVRWPSYGAANAVLAAEGVSKAEAEELAAAVYELSKTEEDPILRRDLIPTAARNGDRRVLDDLGKEMQRAFDALKDASHDIWQAVLGLEGIGIDLVPPETTSAGSDTYELNARMAATYLYGTETKKIFPR